MESATTTRCGGKEKKNPITCLCKAIPACVPDYTEIDMCSPFQFYLRYTNILWLLFKKNELHAQTATLQHTLASYLLLFTSVKESLSCFVSTVCCNLPSDIASKS
jgi:hypothetical protein